MTNGNFLVDVPLPLRQLRPSPQGFVEKELTFDVECRTNVLKPWFLYGRTNINHFVVPGDWPRADWRVGWHWE